MKTTFVNDGHIGQIYQGYTLSNGKIIKSVLFTDNCQSPIRYYLKYYYQNLEITREMFEIYKRTLGVV